MQRICFSVDRKLTFHVHHVKLFPSASSLERCPGVVKPKSDGRDESEPHKTNSYFLFPGRAKFESSSCNADIRGAAQDFCLVVLGRLRERALENRSTSGEILVALSIRTFIHRHNTTHGARVLYGGHNNKPKYAQFRAAVIFLNQLLRVETVY